METIRALNAVFACCLFLSLSVRAQETSTYRVFNLTLNTLSPSDLQINRGRLIWKESDGGGAIVLKYYSGAEIATIDSPLTNVRFAIDGDYIIWNTPSKLIKSFNTRTWKTDTITANAYDPLELSTVSLSNGIAAFVTDQSGSGSAIHFRNLAAGTDSVFSSDVWNREATVSLGQLAWSASTSEDTLAASSINFYDGRTIRTVSDSNSFANRLPILKDAGIVWVQYGSRRRVKAFIGDSLFTLAETGNQNIVAGYDISDGIAIGAVTDTVNTVSRISIFRPSTGTVTVVVDSNLIQPPHIDNGEIVWVSGTGGGKVMKLYHVADGTTDQLGIADYPVIDEDQIAWTLGDAIEMRVPVTFEKVTSDGVNGSAQRRFKTIERGNILWGNFADPVLSQRTSPRMFYAGASPVRLTDSTVFQDFEMVNSGFAIWRRDFNQLYMYDGVSAPVRIFDSLQCENMYIADSSIGFHGFRTGQTIQQAWIYRIRTDTLIQLTRDSVSTDTSNGTTLVDGNAAVWYRTEKTDVMLMYYDGVTKARMTDSLVGFRFSFVNGVIVWSERRNGVYQIMMKSTSGGVTIQLTDGMEDAMDPVTDGLNIAWFENTVTNPTLVYYNIASGKKTNVAHVASEIAHWMWMSNGKIAWTEGNEARVFDGSVVSQLTGTGGSTPNTDVYVDNETLVWKERAFNPGIPALGDIYRGKLHAFASFDATNIAGTVPLAVTFTNQSWQGAQSYLWEFGDGATSTQASPQHIYTNPGNYSVTLTVTGLTGQSVENKWNLVRAVAVTGVTDEATALPRTFALEQNYPNPFNPTTTIRYQVPVSGPVEITVYDVLGRSVANLVKGIHPAGVSTVSWDASNVPSGVYFCRMEAGGFVQTRKLVLVK